MITIVPYLAEHLVKMKEDHPFLEVGGVETYARTIEREHMAYTAMEDGKPIGCAGVLPCWPGMGEAWAHLTPRLQKHPLALQRAVKQCLPKIRTMGGFHRIQSHVLVGFEAGVRWVETMGFQFEGICKKYGPDKKDYYQFAITY